MFAAFEAPGYRFVAGSALSFTASWTTDQLVQGWVVLELTNSPFWVGAAAGMRGVSQLLFSLAGGAVADRLDRRRVLIGTYLLLATIALSLGALAASGRLALWNMLPLVVLGGANGLVGPNSSAMTYDVVGPARLMNASAFSFMSGAVVRTLAALAGGLALDRLGVAPAYVLVAALFLFTAAILVPLRVPAKPRGDAPHEGTLVALRGGLRYAARTRAVRDLLILSAITEMFGFAYLAVLPVVARDVLHQTATGLGLLAAASAAGQFVAMIGLSLAGDVRRKGLILIGSTLAFGIAIIGLGLSSVFVLSLAIVFCVGAAASLYDTSMWTVVQMTASEEMRGRVLGLYMATYGLSQIGGFVIGAMASITSVPLALGLAGIFVALNAARLLRAVARFTPQAAHPPATEFPPAGAPL